MKKIKSYSKDIITIVESVFKFLKLFNNEINASIYSLLDNMNTNNDSSVTSIVSSSIRISLENEFQKIEMNSNNNYLNTAIEVEDMSIGEIRSHWECCKS